MPRLRSSLNPLSVVAFLRACLCGRDTAGGPNLIFTLTTTLPYVPAGVAVTLLVALSSGAVTGLVLRSIDFHDYVYFTDSMWVDEEGEGEHFDHH